MTQLGELRDASARFERAGVKLYAVSYDDQAALAAFAAANAIRFPLLSDSGSRVIRQYGILNTLVRPDEAPFYGVPFPGTYVVDEGGVVVEKFFPRHLANRESPETVLESALGRLLMGEDEARATGGADGIRITAWFHGGGGTLKNGIRRRIVVRFELPDGVHVYGEPVPAGMVPVTITVTGPTGVVVEPPILPPTTRLRLPGIDTDLRVWSGTVDFAVPLWANSHLIDLFKKEVEPTTVALEVAIRYQACTDRACLIPRTERVTLAVPLAPLDVPNLPDLALGGRVTRMDSTTHLAKLLGRFT